MAPGLAVSGQRVDGGRSIRSDYPASVSTIRSLVSHLTSSGP